MEPIDEPAPPRRAPRRAAPAPVPRERRGGIGKWVALLFVLALIAGGIVAYQALDNAGARGVQLREQVDGQVDRAIDELRGLIEDNTQ